MHPGFQNIIDSKAIEISLMGILIVFMALAFISLFLSCLPKVLAFLDPYLPKIAHPHHHSASPGVKSPPAHDDQESIVAAIGYAMHHRKK